MDLQPYRGEKQAIPRADSLRRHLALHLPRWATDCLKRAEPALAELTAPFALYEKIKGAMRLVELDARAEAAGLFAAQSLSDARTLCPGLVVREIDRPLLAAIFAEFADWHSYASPIVVVPGEAGYGDLVLDISGVSHLFGGEQAMLKAVTGRLEGLGFAVTGAIADTVGAAWALAHFSPGEVAGSDIAARLAPLPVAALRLEEAQVEGLMQMGLKQIGQLYGRNRQALTARFGASLVLRLDQALGRIGERVKPRLPPVTHFAERRFAEPVGLMDDVLMTAHDLAVRLAHDLERAGLGAQEFHLFLYRVDHKVISLAVRAGRATRDAGHIGRLFAHRAERLGAEYDAGFGIDMIRLAAGLTSPLDPTQFGAFETREGTADLDRLYDRMASRLGGEAVLRMAPVDTHIPEQAVRLEPILNRPAGAFTFATEAPQRRPLRLLPQPEPIEAFLADVPDGPPRGMVWRRRRYGFRRAAGPERIAPEWWLAAALPMATRQLDDEPSPNPAAPFVPEKTTRDYFVVEDEGGRRFWLFREGLYGGAEPPLWFLHGFLA